MDVAVGTLGGLVEYIQEQVGQSTHRAATVVPAGSDVLIGDGLVLEAAKARGVALVDNAFVDIVASDASGNLSVLSIQATLLGSSFTAANLGARGIQVAVPPGNIFPKVASSILSYGFDFPPVREDLITVPNDNLIVLFNYWLRNSDGVNPHSFTANYQVLYRIALGSPGAR